MEVYSFVLVALETNPWDFARRSIAARKDPLRLGKQGKRVPLVAQYPQEAIKEVQARLRRSPSYVNGIVFGEGKESAGPISDIVHPHPLGIDLRS